MTTSRGFISQCENEPLHLSGAIQPHGGLLVAGPDGRVTHASANLGPLLGVEPGSLLGEPLPVPLATPLGRLGRQPGARLTAALDEGVPVALAMLASRSAQGQAVIELLPDEGMPALPNAVPPAIPIGSQQELLTQRHDLVSRIAELSGFDRVLFYQFLPNGEGEVLAEALGDEARGRYLGLRFPASDIPRIARALYVKNPWRSIPDAAAPSVPLLGLDDAPAPDLTLADLRSLSPVHRLYLRNMGVAAAISFPLASGDELTALVSCHAAQPRRLPLARLKQISREVEAYALAERTYLTLSRQRTLDGFEHRLDNVRRQVNERGGLQQAWPLLGPWLMTEFGADGAMLCGETITLGEGLCLEPAALDAVERWCEGEETVLRISDHLPGDCPDMPLSEVAGLLVVSLVTASGERLRCYLCRQEQTQQVAWGGNPDKPVELQSGPVPIAPRRSFEAWLETRLGYSHPWPEQARLMLLRLRQLLQEAA